jgi:hypothetical protein
MGLKHFIETHSVRWMILPSGKALPATFVHYLRMFGFLVRLCRERTGQAGLVKSLQRKALYRRSQGRAEIAQFGVDLAGSTHGFSYLFA